MTLIDDSHVEGNHWGDHTSSDRGPFLVRLHQFSWGHQYLVQKI